MLAGLPIKRLSIKTAGMQPAAIIHKVHKKSVWRLSPESRNRSRARMIWLRKDKKQNKKNTITPEIANRRVVVANEKPAYNLGSAFQRPQDKGNGTEVVLWDCPQAPKANLLSERSHFSLGWIGKIPQATISVLLCFAVQNTGKGNCWLKEMGLKTWNHRAIFFLIDHHFL